MKLMLLALVLSGCAHGPCFFQHPLDGKAVGWCKREKLAKEYCGIQGVADYSFNAVKCK